MPFRWIGARRRRRIGTALISERVGLADQPGQLSQWVALAPSRLIAAAIVIVGGERSVLISVSHRDGASLWEGCPVKLQANWPPDSPKFNATGGQFPTLPHLLGSMDAQNA